MCVCILCEEVLCVCLKKSVCVLDMCVGVSDVLCVIWCVCVCVSMNTLSVYESALSSI